MLFTNTPCVLENCAEISIGPYNLGYPMLKQNFQSSLLDISKLFNYIDNNQWMRVDDLSKTEGTENWKMIDENTVTPIMKEVEGMEAPSLIGSIGNVCSFIT